MNKNAWYVKAAVWVLALLLMFSLFRSFSDPATGASSVSYSNFLQLVRDKQIKEAKIPAVLAARLTPLKPMAAKLKPLRLF